MKKANSAPLLIALYLTLTAGVYDPSLAWPLGFDREAFWCIVFNTQSQCHETMPHLDKRRCGSGIAGWNFCGQ
jgi:hypothetical protein